LSTSGWTDYDEGYLRARRWAETLSGGGALPVEAAPVPLEPGEVAHAHVAPVTFAAYFVQGMPYQPTYFVFGGPVGLGVTASVQYGREAAWRAQAERAGTPQWHLLGAAGVLVTNERLILTGGERTGALAYSQIGRVQFVAGMDGGPAVQLQPEGDPALQLAFPWAPVLYVFVHHLVNGRPPAVPIPPAVLERAKTEGRL
jgi:hypothetical protein